MECSEISAECPVEQTIYGYYPNQGANAFFAAFFGGFMLINIVLGVRYRAWIFLVLMSLGCLTESIGYVGRLLLHDNPFSEVGFEIQICCLTIAPAFFAAGIYLTLKHVVICFGEAKSLLRPAYYTWVFISCDFVSLVLQGAGGAIAATSNDNESLSAIGSNIMLAGICFQVATLFAFAALAALYGFRVSRSKDPLSASAQQVIRSTRFKLFISGFLVALLTTFIRCIYRIAEMAGGWGNPLMQKELEFIVLDSAWVFSFFSLNPLTDCIYRMTTIAVLVMTIFHPGFCFPQMVSPAKKSKISDVEQKTISETSLVDKPFTALVGTPYESYRP